MYTTHRTVGSVTSEQRSQAGSSRGSTAVGDQRTTREGPVLRFFVSHDNSLSLDFFLRK